MAKFYSSAVPEYQADKEQFEFVQMKDDIADATFQDKPIGFFKDAMLRFCRSKVSIVAFVGIVIILFMAIFMPMMSHWHYNDQDLNRINLPPKMPVLENVGILDGTRWLTNRRVDSLEDTTRYPEGSILKVINYRKVQGVDMCDIKVDYYKYCGLEDGTYFWMGTDYYGGKIDMVMMRITEIIGAFPEIVVVTLFILFFGTGMLSIILCLVVQNWIGTARMIRSQFYRYKGSEYVLAARTLGVKDMALIFRHILPNSIGPIITRAMIAIPGAIFTESFLAYIGLGIRAPESSIGVLLSQGQKIMQQYPNQVFFPAVVISLLMIAFNMLSNGLRDAFDPTQRGA